MCFYNADVIRWIRLTIVQNKYPSSDEIYLPENTLQGWSANQRVLAKTEDVVLLCGKKTANYASSVDRASDIACLFNMKE